MITNLLTLREQISPHPVTVFGNQNLIIRFVDVISNPENEIAAASVKEHFLGFVPLKETTGAGMTETILQQLEEMSSSIENLRCQGYAMVAI